STTTVMVAQFLGYPAAQGTAVYQNALMTNPDMSKAKATAYIDTIMGYVNPRIVTCLSLTTGINYMQNLSSNVRVSPNPASSTSTIYADVLAGEIRTVKLYDILGNLILNVDAINNRQFTIDRNKLDAGVYIIKTTFDKGEATGKLIFN
ncbi:MAG: T9SS type A sorting domain-containing protein, partial [Bacteroidota bacterium]